MTSWSHNLKDRSADIGFEDDPEELAGLRHEAQHLAELPPPVVSGGIFRWINK